MATGGEHGALEWLKDFWAPIAALGGAIAGWADMRRRVFHLEKDQEREARTDKEDHRRLEDRLKELEDHGSKFRVEVRDGFAGVHAAISKLDTSIQVLAVQKKDKE